MRVASVILALAGSGLALAQLSPLDKSVSPCENFYQYSCGIWMKNNPIPGDQSRWGTFNTLDERNKEILRGILETAAKPAGTRDALSQKIGDFYASCMDEAAINKNGADPLKPLFSRINDLKRKEDLAGLVADLHQLGPNPLFGFGATPDAKNSKMMIAVIGQSGLSLPDRDYYLKDDERSKKIQDQYVAHVTKMFKLLGDSEEIALKKAKAIMNIETELAKVSLDRVARRNPNNTYHKMTTKEMVALAPNFDWNRYLTGVKLTNLESLNVSVPKFNEGMGKVIANTSLDDIKTYLTWHLLHNQAGLLSEPFVQENFDFFGRTLTGAKELRPRWKRCVSMADNALGEALGKKYVETAFAGDSKEKMLEMVDRIMKSMEKDIEMLAWMTPTTKKRALEKLNTVKEKIGYPEKWEDYSSVKIVRDNIIANDHSTSRFAFFDRLGKVGKAVDPTEWYMTPPTVNAYYSPLENTINFPAGILQPPFFDANIDPAVNYGAIGGVIGHELTHGFDDQGRRFDPAGNLQDWWTETDANEFEKRADCVVNQYGGYAPVPGANLNGKLTLGENTADNGGLRLAFMALMSKYEGEMTGKIDGLTPQQRFFVGWGQVWCQNITEEASRLRVATDPHSPGEYRVNGVLSNMPEFQEAFGCKLGDNMVSKSPCRVW